MTEWRECKLSDVMEIIGGGTPKTSVPEYWNGNIPWLSVADFNNGNRYVYDAEKRITELGLKNSSTKLLKKGQLIISARGTVGAIAQLERDMAFNQSCYGLTANSLSTNDFLFYLLKQCIVELKQQSNGGVFDTIIRETFDNINISLPPLPEQKAIAEVLSSLDDKIDFLTRQNKTLEDLVQAYFRKWFIEDASDEWEIGKLGDLCEIITKGTTPTTLKKSFVESGINFLKVESISENGNFIEDKFMHIDEETHNLLRRSQLKEKDILCSIAGTIGRIARVSKEILPANVNQALAIIRVKKHYRFVYYFLKSGAFQNEIRSRIVESVQANLSLSEISGIELTIPEELITKFESFIAPIDDKVQGNINQIRTLSKLRDALLPKLISGEIRVKM